MMRLVIEAIALSPIEVPRRATRVTVAWQSGTVTELEIPRPRTGAIYSGPRRPPSSGYAPWPASGDTMR